MTYDDAIQYIRKVQTRGSKPGLSRMRRLMDMLGNPQKQCRFVHVVGTNGKGSFCSMLANILHCAGYTTGLFTSPHMVKINERMKINGVDISDEELSELLEKVIPLAESMEDDLPTEFEIMTAIGFMFFAAHNASIVVLEAGLGGEKDSTNIIDAPELAVVTNIGLDHTAYLGNTFAEIAATKAKIIKPGCDALFYGQNTEAQVAIQERCDECEVKLTVPDYSRISQPRWDENGSSFIFAGPRWHISLVGIHQIYNAVMVLEAVFILKGRGWKINMDTMDRGLRQTYWPGRFEILQRNQSAEEGAEYKPAVISDGGHNPQGVAATIQTLHEIYPDHKYVFVMGVMADKDVTEILNIMLPNSVKVFTVRPHNTRSMDSEVLADKIRTWGAEAESCDSVVEGVDKALALATEMADGTPIVCIGSLYMYSAVKKYFEK
ncbi:MAG: bifunctional folylpolyglutamate synthase/dihydrofolate synthase [Clostridia bacterium]|nr:bifunctional folylpolyglutamate synthase/dihydrofolate synthase [Clostridia bacterium]